MWLNAPLNIYDNMEQQWHNYKRNYGLVYKSAVITYTCEWWLAIQMKRLHSPWCGWDLEDRSTDMEKISRKQGQWTHHIILETESTRRAAQHKTAQNAIERWVNSKAKEGAGTAHRDTMSHGYAQTSSCHQKTHTSDKRYWSRRTWPRGQNSTKIVWDDNTIKETHTVDNK